eukprot:scaffold11139_cov91-Skeletonema_dohrnii-CCMP3373.AAC.1
MYRFGYDDRLERLLEATLMIMECFKGDKRFNLHITGHNGSSPTIDLVHPSMELDEATQLRVLESVVHANLIFIASLGDEAAALAKAPYQMRELNVA